MRTTRGVILALLTTCLACVDLSRPLVLGDLDGGAGGSGPDATTGSRDTVDAIDLGDTHGPESDGADDGTTDDAEDAQADGPDGDPGSPIDTGLADADAPTGDAPPLDGNVLPDAPVTKPNGQACSSGVVCGSGICADGICCNSACTGVCEACNVAGSLGTCAAIAAGVDPSNECDQDLAATCKRDGMCNGARGCRQYAASVECAAASCTSGSEAPARRCDGNGNCPAPQPRACAPYICGANACAATCVMAADCSAGAICIGGGCSSATGLELYWNFDEATGTQAIDVTGQGRNGTFAGNPGGPAASTLVPSTQFTNPRSRTFTASARTQVRLRNLPPAMLPANNVTLSVWFRATAITDSSGFSEMLSIADGYALVMRSGVLTFSKRIGNQIYIAADFNSTAYLDGQWHHMAGVAASTGGMTLYVDGIARATSPSSGSVAYGLTQDFLVGADMDAGFGAYFGGNLDEVRVYSRPLAAAEVAALAAGGR